MIETDIELVAHIKEALAGLWNEQLRDASTVLKLADLLPKSLTEQECADAASCLVRAELFYRHEDVEPMLPT